MSTIVLIYLIGVVITLCLAIRYFFGYKTLGEWVFIGITSMLSWFGLLLFFALALVRSLKDDKDLNI